MYDGNSNCVSDTFVHKDRDEEPEAAVRTDILSKSSFLVIDFLNDVVDVLECIGENPAPVLLVSVKVDGDGVSVDESESGLSEQFMISASGNELGGCKPSQRFDNSLS